MEQSHIRISHDFDDAYLSKLSGSAYKVLHHMLRRAGTKPNAFPSFEDIKKACGLSENTVRKAIRELQSYSIIGDYDQGFTGKSNTYPINRDVIYKGWKRTGREPLPTAPPVRRGRPRDEVEYL